MTTKVKPFNFDDYAVQLDDGVFNAVHSNLYDKLKEKYYKVKYFIQNAIRGYSDFDVFELNVSMDFRYTMLLKELAKTHQGHPGNIQPIELWNLGYDNIDMDEELWTEILLDMAYYFEHGLEHEEYIYKDYIPPVFMTDEYDEKRYLRGKEAFSHFKRTLYD